MLTLVVPNEKSTLSLGRYVVPVDFMEAITGIDFYPALENGIENQLEGECANQEWEFD